jgi:hypothetical protein
LGENEAWETAARNSEINTGLKAYRHYFLCLKAYPPTPQQAATFSKKKKGGKDERTALSF